MENNCAFQYAKMNGSIGRTTNIVCDKDSLTRDEAEALWNEYYPDAANHIHNGGEVEMVIWIDMNHNSDYDKYSHWIGTDAESDGVRIWETKRTYFPSNTLSALTPKASDNE